MKHDEKMKALQSDMEDFLTDLRSWEPDPEDFDGMYRDMLDSVYGYTDVAGMQYVTSQVLEKIDPVAYRCGRNDYIDALEDTELNKYRYEEFATEYGEIRDRYHAIMEPYYDPQDHSTQFDSAYEEIEALMEDIDFLIE
jgi:hypothetical protein